MNMRAVDWIEALADMAAGTDLDEVSLAWPGGQVRLLRTMTGRFEPADPPVPGLARGAQSGANSALSIRAGAVGRLVRTHPLRTEPWVRLGQSVRKGEVLCALQIGHVLLPVTAPADGRVVAWPVEAGTVVDYGRELAILETSKPAPGQKEST